MNNGYAWNPSIPQLVATANSADPIYSWTCSSITVMVGTNWYYQSTCDKRWDGATSYWYAQNDATKWRSQWN